MGAASPLGPSSGPQGHEHPCPWLGISTSSSLCHEGNGTLLDFAYRFDHSPWKSNEPTRGTGGLKFILLLDSPISSCHSFFFFLLLHKIIPTFTPSSWSKQEQRPWCPWACLLASIRANMRIWGREEAQFLCLYVEKCSVLLFIKDTKYSCGLSPAFVFYDSQCKKVWRICGESHDRPVGATPRALCGSPWP